MATPQEWAAGQLATRGPTQLAVDLGAAGLGVWGVVRLAQRSAAWYHWVMAGLGAWSALGFIGVVRSPGEVVSPVSPLLLPTAPPMTPDVAAAAATPKFLEPGWFEATIEAAKAALGMPGSPVPPSPPEAGYAWPYPAPIRAWNLRRDQPTPVQQIPTPYGPYLIHEPQNPRGL